MNPSEELLEQLGSLARQQDILRDARWDAYAAGALPEGERAALEALAQASPEGRDALEAFAPLGEAAHAKAASRVLALLTPTAAAAPPPVRLAPVIPLSSRRKRLATAITASSVVFAAAAGAALLLRSPSALAPLPTYALGVEGGERLERSGGAPTAGPLRLGPGSRLTLTLRPETTVEGPLALRAALLRGDQALAWEPRAELTPGGAVRISGDREALFPAVAPGRVEVVLVVGRPEGLPTTPKALQELAASASPAPSLRVLRVPIELRGAEPGP